jgi:hypothetical protein
LYSHDSTATTAAGTDEIYFLAIGWLEDETIRLILTNYFQSLCAGYLSADAGLYHMSSPIIESHAGF